MENCCQPKVNSGSCAGFCSTFGKMQGIAPCGPMGKGLKELVTYPWSTFKGKYCPSGTSYLGRGPWEGWRYGSGHIGKNEGLVYGFPDFQYYRKNYCGPCGCGMPPGYMGDRDGKNPNIRYIPLDPRNLLGSGFAQFADTPPRMEGGGGPPNPAKTSCGRHHCMKTSGVYKKTEAFPVKFQVHIGDPSCPDTRPKCKKQDVKVYVPTGMLPQFKENVRNMGGGDADEDGDCEGEAGAAGDGEVCKTEAEREREACENAERKRKQNQSTDPCENFEVYIPGVTDKLEMVQTPFDLKEPLKVAVKLRASNNNCRPRSVYDPCGNCKACQFQSSRVQKQKPEVENENGNKLVRKLSVVNTGGRNACLPGGNRRILRQSGSSLRLSQLSRNVNVGSVCRE